MSRRKQILSVSVIVVILAAAAFILFRPSKITPSASEAPLSDRVNEKRAGSESGDSWLARARLVSEQFHRVYTPCWEGAYGAYGDARLFEVTGDSVLLRFHAEQHDLTQMCEGTWLDDRAWVCLAEAEWWRVTGKTHMLWIADAVRRYDDARKEGRLSNHEGYWSWYNWPPARRINEPIFTNSNMNQMIAVGCRLFEATGERRFLEDALLVWNGDRKTPGIERTLYRGDGLWEGKGGRAAFGRELPWGGLEYASIGAALYKATGDQKYKDIAIATVRRILDPATGWVDPVDFYQVHMDGNGNFVQFLLNAYETFPADLSDVPGKVERMLTHVWTNAQGSARVTLHRDSDHGIRNGWNPDGGEDGYGVDEVGTVHAQGEAVKAFGMFASADHFRRERP